MSCLGIPGVREHSCFLKEVNDAQRIRKRIMDCCETATFKDQSPEDRKRLLHMVVVGGGPTGVEFAGELQDFFENDLKTWMPEIADEFKVTLVEALPSVRFSVFEMWPLVRLLTMRSRFFPCSPSN